MRYFGIFSLCFLVLTAVAFSQDEKSERVAVIQVNDGASSGFGAEGMVDPTLAFFIKRNIEEAKKWGATVIIFEIDTFGGRIDSMVQIGDYISDIKDVRTVAFIKKAVSAGSYIAFACDEIYMAPSSTIGSATPITQGEDGKTKVLEEKFMSYARSQFESMAQSKGHSGALAVAMVDPAKEVVLMSVGSEVKYILRSDIESFYEKNSTAEEERVICPEGTLLNLTATRAQELGLSKNTLGGVKDLLTEMDMATVARKDYKMGLPERIGRILAGGLGGILLSIGLVCIYMEAKTPTWGVFGSMGLMFIGVFFWAMFFAGRSSPMEIVCFLIGIVLIAMEVFVIPGFGFAGISGIILVMASFMLSYMPEGDYTFNPAVNFNLIPDLQAAMAYPLFAILVSFVFAVLIFRNMERLPYFNKLILASDTAYVPNGSIQQDALHDDGASSLLGKNGVAVSSLRPAGRVRFDEQGEVEVVSEGALIESGASVKVIKIQGSRVIVRLVIDA